MSNGRRECYLAWCESERRLSLQEYVENLLDASIKVESEKCYKILKPIIDVHRRTRHWFPGFFSTQL